MMKRFFAAILIALLCAVATALLSQETKGLQVARIAVCTEVQEREPVGVDSTFGSDVGKVYCFTRIEGATDTTSVTHVWYHEDKKMAEVPLRVASASWRTWSSKQIMPAWTGRWKVVILSESGDSLAETSFSITAK